MITTTIGKLAESLDIEYAHAGSLVKLMVRFGKGREVGKEKPKGGKGIGSTIYELNDTFELSLTGKSNGTAS